MGSDKNIGIREVFRFKAVKGFFGRFHFDSFIEDSGLSVLLDDSTNGTKRDDLQRLYNTLTKLWLKSGLIKGVGHHTKKGQKGRRMVLYEPTAPLNFTLGAEGVYVDALETIIKDLQDGINSGNSLNEVAYKCINHAKSVLDAH